MTPELLQTVGEIIVYWAMIDDQITRILGPFWFDHHPEERMPRSFDRRINRLVDILTPMYVYEPDEYRIFKWYVHRLKTANGQRDDISHGIPGSFTRKGRTLTGLMVPFPSRKTKYVPQSLKNIKALSKTLQALQSETVYVSLALGAVRDASLPDIRVWRDPGGWTQITMENRDPMLPRDIPPPPTFQV